jgi:hypothetical protein
MAIEGSIPSLNGRHSHREEMTGKITKIMIREILFTKASSALISGTESNAAFALFLILF